VRPRVVEHPCSGHWRAEPRRAICRSPTRSAVAVRARGSDPSTPRLRPSAASCCCALAEEEVTQVGTEATARGRLQHEGGGGPTIPDSDSTIPSALLGGSVGAVGEASRATTVPRNTAPVTGSYESTHAWQRRRRCWRTP
jgi:hypothetical protein